MWNNLLIEYRMDAEKGPQEYVALIIADVEALEVVLKNKESIPSTIMSHITKISIDIKALESYLSTELKSASRNRYNDSGENQPSFSTHIDKLNKIQMAARNLSISINELSNLVSNTMIAPEELFTKMESMIESIKQNQINALKMAIDGFVKIKKPTMTGKFEIVNEYFVNHKLQAQLRAREKIKEKQKRLGATTPKGTTGGRRSRHRRTRRNCKTRRSKKHSHRGTRRV